MDLEARLAEFKELSQLDQAGCLNAIPDRKTRELVTERIFGVDGWTGGMTPGGILITSSVANAIKAHTKAPVGSKKD
jgi:hypothetical protein